MNPDSKQKADKLQEVLGGKKKTDQKAAPTDSSTPPDEKLKAAQEEAKKNHDRLLRVMAEFENYKKRIAREHHERSQYVHEVLLKELLKVLDDFERVMDHLPEEKSEAAAGLIDGIALVHKDFFNVLTKFGLKEVQIEGETFDPHLHEAIAQVESSDHPEGTIVHCHRKGYRLHERLLRPASVTVAKPKKEGDEKK